MRIDLSYSLSLNTAETIESSSGETSLVPRFEPTSRAEYAVSATTGFRACQSSFVAIMRNNLIAGTPHGALETKRKQQNICTTWHAACELPLAVTTRELQLLSGSAREGGIYEDLE
jgi:hypothetical protein